MKAFDVIGFGALNIDKLFRVNRIAGPEEESSIIEFEEYCGGSAANTIVGLARLGLKTGFIGKVAHDKEGEKLVNDLQREKIDVSRIIHSNHGQSGQVLGFVDHFGDRALYVFSSVNDSIKTIELDQEYVKNTKFLHFSSFFGSSSFQAQKAIVKMISNNVIVSMDPGEIYARKKKLDPLLKQIDALLPNRKELQLLTGKKSFKEGARVLLKKGVNVVGVKLGKDGCYVTDGIEEHVIEPFKVKVVDTTGAGDAFCAGFLYGLKHKKTLYECGKLGNFVASQSVMAHGPRKGLPTLEELKGLL